MSTDKGSTIILPWVTAPELVDTTPVLQWLIKNWFARGVVATFSGEGKTAGKSTLIRAMMRSVLTGEPFLDEPQEIMGDVLYLTEETPAELKPGLQRAGLHDQSKLHILPWVSMPEGLSWRQVMQGVENKAKETSAVWCIIDTLGHFTRGAGRDENSSSDAIEIMRPIQKLAHNTGMGVLVVRHTRKTGGALGQSDRGTGAYGGAGGFLWNMRASSKDSTVRILEAKGRVDGVPQKIVLDYNGKNYSVVERDWGPLEKAAEEDTIIRMLPATRGDIEAAFPGLAGSTLRRRISELLKAGLIVSEGEGIKGDPKIFYKAPQKV
jgi:RecA-family ATPase